MPLSSRRTRRTRHQSLPHRPAPRLRPPRASPPGRRATTPPSPAKASCRTPSSTAAVRMIAEAAASVPLLLYEGDAGDHRAPAARPHRPPQPRLQRARPAGGLVRLPARLRQRLPRGRRRRRRRARAARAAPRPHEGRPRPRRLARGLRVHRRRPQPCASPARRCPACARSCTSSCSTPSTTTTASRPIEAAATAIDIHNTASRWNKALLDNSARPSGALVYTARDGNLTAEQYDRLKAELEQGFQGAAHAGRPLLLEGGLDWKSMSLSPQGHGLHRGQARRRPRDRAGARRAAHAARHPRRQHLLQLPGSHPHLLAPDRPAPRQPHRQGALAWLAPAAVRPSRV